jgi:outer membrane protein assembly factor BamB
MAIDAWQGVEHYSRTAADDPFTSSPAVSEDGLTVYIGSGAGQLLAHSANGDQKWINPYPDTISGDDLGATPAVDGQNIYAAGEAGYVFRVSDAGANATPGWMFKARDDINSSPVLAGGNLVVCDDSGYVYFLNPATGAVVGEFRCDGDITASPAVGANGNIYVGTEQGTMYAISPAGALVWADTITPFAVIYSSAVIAGDGGIVFGADDGYLYKLDPANGQPMAGWPVALSTSGIASTAAICADGVIYVVTEDDMLHAVRNDGTPHWANPVELVLPPQARGPARPRRLGSADLSPSVLVDQHGIIYAASTINGIFAIAGRPAGRLATTAWPMFQHDIRHSGKAGSW